MRFPGEDTEVLTRGMSERRSFSIEANAKAFRTLIDTLYSDKIESPIRELMSNAMDSHIAAGKADIPFEVHLPVKLNPTFSVKDYGVGMTHEFVMDLFSTLYYSSKDGTREEDIALVDPDSQTGTLGLGSKSFFGCTDSSTLTCTDGVEKRIYSLHMATGRVPDIALMARLPCTEPTSVKMEFSVRDGDYNKFYHAFKHVMLGYDQIPNILPSAIMDQYHSDRNSSEITQVTPNIKRYQNSHRGFGFNDGIRIRQGTVTYPASPKILENRDVKVALTLLSLGGYNRELHVIDFPLGSISFTPSREHLEDTEENIKRIVGQLQIMTSSIKLQLVDEINELPTIQHKLRHCQQRFRNLEATCKLLGLDNVINYLKWVEKFEESVKLTRKPRYSGVRNTPSYDLKERIFKGKTAAIEMNIEKTTEFYPSRWYKKPVLFINDKYEKYGVGVRDHATQGLLHIRSQAERKDLYPRVREFTAMIAIEEFDYIPTEVILFFNTTREALQLMYPAAKIYLLSELPRTAAERKPVLKGENELGPVTVLDATDRLVIYRETRHNKDKIYHIKSWGRQINVDWPDLKKLLVTSATPYLVAHGRYAEKIVNLDKQVTFDQYVDQYLNVITKYDLEAYIQDQNEKRIERHLTGVDFDRLYEMWKYIPDPLMSKLVPLDLLRDALGDKRKGSAFDKPCPGYLHSFLLIFRPADGYLVEKIDEICRKAGYHICPPGSHKDYFRPSELTYLRFLTTVYDVLTEVKNMGTDGLGKSFRRGKKLPEHKYLNSIFRNLEEYLMELRSNLERKYDAQL